MQRASQVFIPLTGRCFLCRHDKTQNAHSPFRQYTQINRAVASTERTHSVPRSPLISSPLQQLTYSQKFGMNDYYRQRFRRTQMLSPKRNNSSRSNKQHQHSIAFRVGDIVIRLIPRLMNNAYHDNKKHNRLLSSAQHIRNSAANAHHSSESFSDGIMRDMHMLDGSEVAEINQGLVSVGKVVLFGVCSSKRKPYGTTTAQTQPQQQKHSWVISSHHVQSYLRIIENAAPLLCERRILQYRSQYEAMQLVDMIRHHFEHLYTHNLLRLKILKGSESVNDVDVLRFVIAQKHAANNLP